MTTVRQSEADFDREVERARDYLLAVFDGEVRFYWEAAENGEADGPIDAAAILEGLMSTLDLANEEGHGPWESRIPGAPNAPVGSESS